MAQGCSRLLLILNAVNLLKNELFIWAFAALRELRLAQCRSRLLLILNAVNLLKNEVFFWAFAALS